KAGTRTVYERRANAGCAEASAAIATSTEVARRVSMGAPYHGTDLDHQSKWGRLRDGASLHPDQASGPQPERGRVPVLTPPDDQAVAILGGAHPAPAEPAAARPVLRLDLPFCEDDVTPYGEMGGVEPQGPDGRGRRPDQVAVCCPTADGLAVHRRHEGHVFGPAGQVGVDVLAQPGLAPAGKERICVGHRQHNPACIARA